MSKERMSEGFFIGDNDFQFFQNITQEYIEDIVEVPVGYYRTCPEETEVNVYGESKEGRKLFEKPLELKCLIQPDDQETDGGDFTFNVNRNVTFGFQRERLKEFDVYPERGDFIEFDNDYYEVESVVDNDLLGSQWHYRHSIVLEAHLARNTSVTIVDPETLDIVETNSKPNDF